MSSKSIKCIHTKDRISNLPEAIILHILSFMEAKTAVKTGILSKRFAFLWTEVPSLNFEQATMDFVYTTICFHKRLNLEKVSVTISSEGKSDPDDKIKFQRFIRLLNLANVKEFVLDLFGFDYIFPQHFYSNHSLRKLTFTECNMPIDGFVNWKSLQSLFFSIMELSDDTINDILSGCPSLEFLELYEIRGFSTINLTNNKCLRKLVIGHYFVRGTLEIVAPNLQSLALSGGINWFKCKVRNANSLSDCLLDFYEDNDAPNEVNVIKMLTSLLEDLSHVGVVTIGEWILQVLLLIELNKAPCPMSKAIKCLKIRTNLTKNDMTGIACLLRHLILLDTLSIELYHYDQEFFLPLPSGKDRECEKNKRFCTSKNMQTMVDLKLKNFKVCNVKAHTKFQDDMDEVLSLAKFLLKNGKFLENMTISAKGSEHYLQKLAYSLMGFPRSSPRAVVKLEDWQIGDL